MVKLMTFRVGMGFDVHRLVENRDLWIGGVKIPFEKGLDGHSDADVAIHAICDAILGAANMRDIGFHFSDKDPKYKNIDSKILLAETVKIVAQKGYKVGNVDVTICAEYPKMNPHIPDMCKVLSAVMEIDIDAVSIKATTTERLGFTGRMEGISAYAVALLERNQE